MRLISIAIILQLGMPQILHAAPKVLPVLVNPIADINQSANGSVSTIDLTSIFGAEEIDDQVVRFTSQASNGNLVMDFALFSTRTPGTRTNFLNYVNDGDYNNSFIHRSIPGFVIQGGGFYDSTPGSGLTVANVPTDPPITNEFSISNTYATISMAKTASGPDSATSQWFVNLGANSDNLDNQNGGFTVFGRVTKSTISTAASFGNSTEFPLWNAGGAFNSWPLIASFNNSSPITDTDLILFPSVILAPITPGDAGESTVLSYAVINNSNSSVVTTSVTAGSQLQLNYPPNASGTSTLTVRATDSVGNTVDDTFTVNILQTYTAWRNSEFTATDAADDAISGPGVDTNNDGLTNLELFLHGFSIDSVHKEPTLFSDTIISDAHYPTFKFPITNNITGVTAEIQKSNDLGISDPWVVIPHTEISRTTSGITDTVTLRSKNASSGNKSFYRLVFTLAP